MHHAAAVLVCSLSALSLAGCENGPRARAPLEFYARPIVASRPAATVGATPVVVATDASFGRELAASKSSAVINFTAKWCGPCRAMAPALDSLAAERGGRMKVIRVDVDESPATARRYSISALPAVLVLSDGVVVKRMVGYQSRENLAMALKAIQ